MNNKLLSAVLVAGIAATGFAGMSSADESNTGTTSKTQHERIELTVEQKAEREAVKALMEKKRDGDTLTAEETTTIEDFIASNPHKGGKRGGGKGHGKKGGKMGKNLTDEEKTTLESMSDEDKKAFFDTKKQEHKVERETAKEVMDKILAGTTLSSIEEATRLEIVAKMSEKEANSKGKKRGGNNESVGIMKKLVNLEALTAEEKTTLTEMKAKHEEREASREAIAPIMKKKKAGTDLTEAEETQLEAFKAEHKGEKKGHGKGGKRGGHKGMDK